MGKGIKTLHDAKGGWEVRIAKKTGMGKKKL